MAALYSAKQLYITSIDIYYIITISLEYYNGKMCLDKYEDSKLIK